MSTTFGIFAAIILAVAIFVGIKNNTKMEEEIANRKEQQRLLGLSRERLDAALIVLKDLPIQRKAVDDENAKQVEVETKLKEDVKDLQADLESKTTKTASNAKKLDEIRTKLARVGNIRELADKMKKMRDDRNELAQEIETKEAQLVSLTEQNELTQQDSDRRKLELDTLGKGQSLPTLKTSIRTIYPTWGFVTLAHGNNAGVNSTSTLDVMRDGEVIAKLLVTTVESRSASATIIPDSLAPDVTLMVGDQVVPAPKVEEVKPVAVTPEAKPLAPAAEKEEEADADEDTEKPAESDPFGE